MTLFFVGVALLFGAGVVAVSARSRVGDTTVVVLTLAGALVAAIPAVGVLAGGGRLVTRLHSGLPGGDWVIGIDPLSGVFLLVILGVGATCAVFGVAYMRDADHPVRSALSHMGVAALLIAMALVVTAQSVVLFLCAWELMAITSFALIMAEHERAEVRRAGLLYLVITHTATLALFVMFALWSRGTADWSFASLAAQGLPSRWPAAALLACAAVGFGAKAGLVPAHFWLPPAHAAAPSHVSAIMSGLVIKMGIYGLLRVSVLAGTMPLWWGWALLAVGVASALLGVLWALVQHDLKRLLAFHSVENVGIIAMGIGVGVLGTGYGHPGIAVLGYAAALLHTVNHAVFKALLFLSAGAVQRATHTRNIEALGGLARRMRATWGAFAVGAAAIVGLPPLNGFVSEWLLFLALFGAAGSRTGIRIAALAVPALAVVGALALACFAKVAGVAFLGRARGTGAASAREVSAAFLIPTWALAAVCVGIGLFAGVVVPPILAVAGDLMMSPAGLADPVVVAALAGARGITGFGALLIALLGGVYVVRRWLLRRVSVRTGPTWGCAYPGQTPRMQYTASSFAAPLVRMFGALAGIDTHRGATVFHTSARDLVLDGVAIPVWRLVQRGALRLRPLQRGRLNVYLAYVVATLVLLLAYMALAPAAAP